MKEAAANDVEYFVFEDKIHQVSQPQPYCCEHDALLTGTAGPHDGLHSTGRVQLFLSYTVHIK